MKQFTYSLKLHDGRLLHADGETVEAAAKKARVKMSDIKRFMPVGVVEVVDKEKEREQKKQRLAALRKARAALKEKREIKQEHAIACRFCKIATYNRSGICDRPSCIANRKQETT